MTLYHIYVTEIRKGFLEVRANDIDEAFEIANEVIEEEPNPGIHWTKEITAITKVKEHPDEWTNDNF